jgi:hypothetical protein
MLVIGGVAAVLFVACGGAPRDETQTSADELDIKSNQLCDGLYVPEGEEGQSSGRWLKYGLTRFESGTSFVSCAVDNSAWSQFLDADIAPVCEIVQVQGTSTFRFEMTTTGAQMTHVGRHYDGGVYSMEYLNLPCH